MVGELYPIYFCIYSRIDQLIDADGTLFFHAERYGPGGDSAVLSDILSSTMASLQATFVHAKEIAVINLVLSVISLLGAILMFQLRRIGFYFYTAAQILMLFVLPYFAGFNFMVLAGMLFSAILLLSLS